MTNRLKETRVGQKEEANVGLRQVNQTNVGNNQKRVDLNQSYKSIGGSVAGKDLLNTSHISLIKEKLDQSPQPSRYSYISKQNAAWVDEILGVDGISRLGDNPHPVELIFELTCNYVPSLRDMPCNWKTPRNRLKSKLSKVRDFFMSQDIQSPLHWCPFVDFTEEDEKFCLNFNASIAAMKNHYLMEEYNTLMEEQHKMVELCRSLRDESNSQRAKLKAVLDELNRNPNIPFAKEIRELISKEPSCFKPLDKSLFNQDEEEDEGSKFLRDKSTSGNSSKKG